MVPGPCHIDGNSADCDCSDADPLVVFTGEFWDSGEGDEFCTFEYKVEGNPEAPEVGSWSMKLISPLMGELTVFNEGTIIDKNDEGTIYTIGPHYYRHRI